MCKQNREYSPNESPFCTKRYKVLMQAKDDKIWQHFAELNKPLTNDNILYVLLKSLLYVL